MAYKQSPGRMNMPKTGAGIPSALTMPDPDPKDPKDPKNAKRKADRLAAKDPKENTEKQLLKKIRMSMDLIELQLVSLMQRQQVVKKLVKAISS